MSLSRKEIYEFGDFRLDVDERTIERIDGLSIGTLPDKTFDVLVLLVRRCGHLIPKDELLQHVWPDTIVEENNLEKRVHQLRQFLRDDGNGIKYIETIRKHGYRFVAGVDKIEVSRSWLPETYRHFEQRNEGAEIKASSDYASETSPVLSEGLGPVGTEPEKVNRAARQGQYFSGRPAAVIGVMVVVVAVSVIAYLAFVRGASTSGTDTDNEEAYRLYHQGIALDDKRGDSAKKGLEYLEQAVALDPNFARAWAGIALTVWSATLGIDQDTSAVNLRSMQALNKALEVDPNLSEAHSALCWNKILYDYDFAAAEEACKRAIQLDPSSPVAHRTYWWVLITRKERQEEALAEIKTAIDLEPASYINYRHYANGLFLSRRYDEAAVQWQRVMELDPTDPVAYKQLINVLEAQGKYGEAFEWFIKLLILRQKDTELIQQYKDIYRASGWPGVLIERAKQGDAGLGSTSEFRISCSYAAAGEKDKAFEHLEKAYMRREWAMPQIQVHPQLDSLRDDPRYRDLLGRIAQPR